MGCKILMIRLILSKKHSPSGFSRTPNILHEASLCCIIIGQENIDRTEHTGKQKEQLLLKMMCYDQIPDARTAPGSPECYISRAGPDLRNIAMFIIEGLTHRYP